MSIVFEDTHFATLTVLTTDAWAFEAVSLPMCVLYVDTTVDVSDAFVCLIVRCTMLFVKRIMYCTDEFMCVLPVEHTTALPLEATKRLPMNLHSSPHSISAIARSNSRLAQPVH